MANQSNLSGIQNVLGGLITALEPEFTDPLTSAEAKLRDFLEKGDAKKLFPKDIVLQRSELPGIVANFQSALPQTNHPLADYRCITSVVMDVSANAKRVSNPLTKEEKTRIAEGLTNYLLSHVDEIPALQQVKGAEQGQELKVQEILDLATGHTYHGLKSITDELQRKLKDNNITFGAEQIQHYFQHSAWQDIPADDLYISERALNALVEKVRNEHAIPEIDHPFAADRAIAAVLSYLPSHALVACNGYNKLSADQVDKLEEIAVAPIFKNPGKYPRFNSIPEEKRSAATKEIFWKLGTGQAEYQKIMDSYREQPSISEQSTPTNDDNKSPEGKIAFWKPLAALLGAVGIAYAASGKEEQPAEGKEGEEPKKQSWFKPVLKWLGIAIAAVSAVELGYSLANKSSPIVGPVTAKLFKNRNTPSTTIAATPT